SSAPLGIPAGLNPLAHCRVVRRTRRALYEAARRRIALEDPCAGCAPRLPGLCAPLGDDPTFATRRQNCQPSQLRRGFSYSRTLLTAWSEIGLKACDLHRCVGEECGNWSRTPFGSQEPPRRILAGNNVCAGQSG